MPIKFSTILNVVICAGLCAIVIMFIRRHSEDLVKESTPVSTLEYDVSEVAKPYETATFGMG